MKTKLLLLIFAAAIVFMALPPPAVASPIFSDADTVIKKAAYHAILEAMTDSNNVVLISDITPLPLCSGVIIIAQCGGSSDFAPGAESGGALLAWSSGFSCFL